MSSFTLNHKYGRCTRLFRNVAIIRCLFECFINYKTIIQPAFVGYEIVIANTSRWLSSVLYISNGLHEYLLNNRLHQPA